MTKIIKHPNKRNVWLYHFLNENNPETFMNRTASAKAAGYRGKSEESYRSIGYQNFTILHDVIEKWLDEHKLSEVALKNKLITLIDAKETKFFAHEGKITDSVDVEALEIQRKSLEMAMKVKGMFEKDNAQSRADLFFHIEQADRRAEELAERVCKEMKAKTNDKE